MQPKHIPHGLLTLGVCAVVYFTSYSPVHAGINQSEHPEENKAPKIIHSSSPKMRAISVPNSVIIKPVVGYLGEQFVQGEVTLTNTDQNSIEGYIYLNNDRLYIYGEIHQNTITAYDTQGNLYLLRFDP